MATPAPIVLFVYNRPLHTERILESLKQNFMADESLLYIMADGAKKDASHEDKQSIAEVRAIIKRELWCKEVIIDEKETNQGLANSVIATVTALLEKHGKLIILEDDLVLSKYALHYFNTSLTRFETDKRINCIHGYSFPAKYKADYFFMKGADCWGWATWKDRWEEFNADGATLVKEIEAKNLRHEFDFFGTYGFFHMLKEQVQGKNDSWAIRWYASSFLKNKLTLYPKVPFTINEGNDGSGYHTKGNSEIYRNALAGDFEPAKLLDLEVEENANEKKRTAIFFSEKSHSKKERIILKIKQFFS